MHARPRFAHKKRMHASSTVAVTACLTALLCPHLRPSALTPLHLAQALVGGLGIETGHLRRATARRHVTWAVGARVAEALHRGTARLDLDADDTIVPVLGEAGHQMVALAHDMERWWRCWRGRRRRRRRRRRR